MSYAIEAVHHDGLVSIITDPATARAMADAWEFAHVCGGLDDQARPAYLLDIATIRRAAAYADHQNGVTPAVRLVPTLPTGGEQS